MACPLRPRTCDKTRCAAEATPSDSWRNRDFDLRIHCEEISLPRRRLMFFPRRHDRCKQPAMMRAGAEAVERVEMLRHAVALVGLETIARAILRQHAHQAV